MADLPSSYDLIVIGTGMPECIVAAAAARIGKSVLHLDKNEYYGGLWASFNFEHLNAWINKQKTLSQEPTPRVLEASWLEQLDDNEHLVLCPHDMASVSDILLASFLEQETVSDVKDSIAREQQIDTGNQQASFQSGDFGNNEAVNPMIDVSQLTIDESNTVFEAVGSNISQQSFGDNASEQLSLNSTPHHVDNNNAQQITNGIEQVDSVISNPSSLSQSDLLPDVDHAEVNIAETETSAASVSIAESNPISSAELSIQPVRRWTSEDFHHIRHKFNIDLSPKLLFSRGALVELLISSNTSRYADFQSVNHILTFIDGHLEQVPCSRADVFSTKNVNVVEKRMLMKLFNFCSEFEKHPEEYRGYEGRPFVEFLRSRKITPNVEHYVLHAIAMVDDSCMTLQGLKATQKFMDSLGRFGNSPFLWTCYGSAELPQCFCRFCAVFGGIYYLGRDADAIVLDNNNCCVGIISKGQKLKCSSLVMEYNYSPVQYRPVELPAMISRAIYITNGSILPTEKQQNTFLRLPPVDGIHSAISVLEFGSLSFVCPENLYVVHMTSKPFNKNVEDDFALAEKQLFATSENENASNGSLHKPNVLWKLHFRHADVSHLDISCKTPAGVFLTSTPGLELDFEHAVIEARNIFERIYPNEEFLPHAPDPEDIIMEEYSNPGETEEHKIPCSETNLDHGTTDEDNCNEQHNDQNNELESTKDNVEVAEEKDT